LALSCSTTPANQTGDKSASRVLANVKSAGQYWCGAAARGSVQR
jgi:hypothetical protein